MGTQEKAKLGIALGGGAARGMAHIGVFKVMEREGIRFDLVSGNSAGSMVGALYAAGYSWKDMYDFASEIRPLDILRKRVRLCIHSGQLEDIMKRAVGDKTLPTSSFPLRPSRWMCARGTSCGWITVPWPRRSGEAARCRGYSPPRPGRI